MLNEANCCFVYMLGREVGGNVYSVGCNMQLLNPTCCTQKEKFKVWNKHHTSTSLKSIRFRVCCESRKDRKILFTSVFFYLHLVSWAFSEFESLSLLQKSLSCKATTSSELDPTTSVNGMCGGRGNWRSDRQRFLDLLVGLTIRVNEKVILSESLTP